LFLIKFASKMLVFPNAKINIGLNIVSKRPDGFHNLETVFYPIALTDALEFVENKGSKQLPLFTNSGLVIEGNPEQNLVVKAYHLMKQKFGLPPISIHLHKVIPFGAGLGGGSADAAFMVTALNKHFELSLSTQQLIEIAAQLGSDCPFFVINKPCIASGRGEILSPIELNLSGYIIVLVKPDIHISTAQAFAGITPKQPACRVSESIQKPIESWDCTICNDFENHIFKAHPVLANIKHEFYKAGAVYAAMSGSGSTIYGIFKTEPNVDFNGCYVWKGKML
jgi:4-diphosphocytidyl-2-C-methyl-D-erythritol kinase